MTISVGGDWIARSDFFKKRKEIMEREKMYITAIFFFCVLCFPLNREKIF